MKFKFFILSCLISITATAAAFDPQKHVVRQESYWGDYKNKKISEKLIDASPEIIDYITQSNISSGWPNRPKTAPLSEEFHSDIIKALEEIPADISAKINKKLTGILVVNDLGGSASTDYVQNLKGDQVAGFVTLDISVLDRTANDWATWKEQSPFKADSEFKIIAKIENTKNNNRKNALQYNLLHEFGHIISIGLAAVAPWETIENGLNSLDGFAFSKLSWQMKNKKFVSIFDGNKFDRSGLRYYGPETKRLPAVDAKKLYAQLTNTNFPTLYAATNPFDDFAESFVSYVHSVRMGRPWLITLSSTRKQVYREHVYKYELCWNKKRCQSKKEMLESILRDL